MQLQEQLSQLEQDSGVQLTLQQRHQLLQYLELLETWNRRLNLTAVRDRAELLRYHFFEGLWVGQQLDVAHFPLADIGSGAGMPGILIQIARRGESLLLVEKSLKKTVFLEEAIRKLRLHSAVFHGRAEDFPHWSRFSVAAMRALRPSAELLKKLAKSGTSLLLFHGERGAGQPSGWRLEWERRYPLSRGRWLRLWAPG